MYILYQLIDNNIENVGTFSTLNKIIEYERNDSDWLYNMEPVEFIPYDDYIKNAEFISWDYANKNIKTKYDNCIYKLKKICELGEGKNVNGDWEYIPIMSCFDNGVIVNIYAEIDYSHKIFI